MRIGIRSTVRAIARAAVMLLVGAAFTGCVLNGPRHHSDGGGPLGVAGLPDGDTVVAYPVDDQERPSGGPWSFGGIDLCLDADDGEAVLGGVAPRATIGEAVEQVGAVVRNRYEGQGPLRSLFGFPPSPESRFRPAQGEAITDRCVDGTRRGQVELIVGLAYTGESGGGWAGESISYTYAGEEYVLELDTRLIVCGRDPALAADCSAYYLQVD